MRHTLSRTDEKKYVPYLEVFGQTSLVLRRVSASCYDSMKELTKFTSTSVLMVPRLAAD